MLLLCIFVFILVVIIRERNYKKTEYYAQTQKSFFRVSTSKGSYGEYLTWNCLKALNGYKKFLFNCYIPKNNGETTEIDVIMLHESGIYVFESKNYSGWIFGTETQQSWTQTLPNGHGRSRKEHFFNPVLQNKVHLKWLCQYLDQDISLFRSYIVFSNRCTLKKITLTSGQHHVLKRPDLFSSVSAAAKDCFGCLTPETIDHLYRKLLPLTQVENTVKTAHIRNLQKKSHPVSADETMICPFCRGKLVLRVAKNGKYAGNHFLGCSNFPKCRYTRNIAP